MVLLEILQNSHENTCVRVSLLINLQAYNFIKKETLTQVFPVNFAKFLITPFLRNTSGRLLLIYFLRCFNINQRIWTTLHRLVICSMLV